MRIMSKSRKNSRKYKSSTDFKCMISFLSDMRCVIRPQNYSVRKNFSNWDNKNEKSTFEFVERWHVGKLGVGNKCSLRCSQKMFAKDVCKRCLQNVTNVIVWKILILSVHWIYDYFPIVSSTLTASYMRRQHTFSSFWLNVCQRNQAFSVQPIFCSKNLSIECWIALCRTAWTACNISCI